MKQLGKLIKVTDYLLSFQLGSHPEIIPVSVVDQENATSQLSHASGDQLLIALPEGNGTGSDTDRVEESINLAFFALAKINGPARTRQLADETYKRLLQLVQDVLEQFTEDITGSISGLPCPLLSGLDIVSSEVIPEYSLFGGWSGYYLEIVLA